LKAPEIIDLGHVGEVASIDAAVVDMLVHGDFIPVIAPIGVGSDGMSYNINADLVAARLRGVEGGETYVTDQRCGLLDGTGKLISGVTARQVDDMIADGTIHGGNVTKMVVHWMQ